MREERRERARTWISRMGADGVCSEPANASMKFRINPLKKIVRGRDRRNERPA
jgi:hypothetical protein